MTPNNSPGRRDLLLVALSVWSPIRNQEQQSSGCSVQRQTYRDREQGLERQKVD